MKMGKNTSLNSSYLGRQFGMAAKVKKGRPLILFFICSGVEPVEARVQPRSAQAVELLHGSLSNQ